MGWLSYSGLMDIARITDNESKACKQKDLDTIFKAANWTDSRGPVNEKSGKNLGEDNPLEALTRAEWMEIIIRVAKAKFGDQHPTMAPVVKQLLDFMKTNLSDVAEMNEDEGFAADLRHQWRLADFYVEETDIVYRRYQNDLRELYDSKIDYKNVGTHNLWSLASWQSLLADSMMLHDDDSFTREEANLCFYLAKFDVIFYQKNLHGYECMDWLSFLEAIGHIARFKDLPRQAELQEQGLESCCDLVEKLTTENTSWNDFMVANPPSAEEDPFHVRLEETIKLLFFQLSRNQDTGPSVASEDEGEGGGGSRPGSKSGARKGTPKGSRPSTSSGKS
jgi:hypothetical protein